MRSLLILFIAFVLVTGCNSDSKSNTKEDKTGTDVTDDRKDVKDGPMENKDEDKNSKYDWTVTDQNKFLEDCRRESEENVAKEKLKDFCSCMLTQAQKYYPDYRQMDEKSDEDDDGEIFGKCLANYGGEEE